MATIFTKIILGEIPSCQVYADEAMVAFLDINPINPGHTLLVPKLEVDSLYDLPDELYHKLWVQAKVLAAALKKATGCPRVGIAVEGFAVPHAHIHLVPLYAGNQLDPNRAKRASVAELELMQGKIVEAMEG